MKLIAAEQKLLALKQDVLQTRDVSACLDIPTAQASKILEQLAKSGRFTRLMRGLWLTKKQIDPLVIAEHLTAPFPCYISLQTALFYHGLISQIPHTIYAVSIARTQKHKTPLGLFSIHHLQPDFFFGFEKINQIKIATPEKALIDLLYLTPAKSKLFSALPEIELLESLSRKKLNNIIKKIPSIRTQSLVWNKIKKLYEKLQD